MLLPDAKRAFGRWFFVASLCAFGLLVNGISYMLTESEGDALMALEFGRSMGFAQPMLPLLAALAYATSFCQEYTCGFCPEIVHRSGVSRYVRSKLLFVMLSGGLTLALSELLFIVLLNIKFPPDFSMPGMMDGMMASGLSAILEQPGIGAYLLYYGGTLLAQFVAGAFWALTALCFSAFYPNLPLTLVTPLVFARLAEELLNIPFLGQLMVSAGNAPLFTGALGALFLEMLPYIVLAIPLMFLFGRRAGRRLRYA